MWDRMMANTGRPIITPNGRLSFGLALARHSCQQLTDLRLPIATVSAESPD